MLVHFRAYFCPSSSHNRHLNFSLEPWRHSFNEAHFCFPLYFPLWASPDSQEVDICFLVLPHVTSALWWRSFGKSPHRLRRSRERKHAIGWKIELLIIIQVGWLHAACAISCVYFCVFRMGAAHLRVSLSGNSCGTMRAGVGGGQASRSQCWWWHSGGICQLVSSAWFPDWRLVSWPCSVAG